MKVIFFYFIFLLLPLQKDVHKIIWNKDQKLSWEDFKGSPSSSSPFAASTATGINFEYSYSLHKNRVELTYKVQSFFLAEASWHIPTKVTQSILDHEQTHFDISELHARILRKRLSGRKFSQNIKNEVETIYLQVEEQRKAMQNKFDLETNHSINHEKELLWEARVAKKLQEYEYWK